MSEKIGENANLESGEPMELWRKPPFYIKPDEFFTMEQIQIRTKDDQARKIHGDQLVLSVKNSQDYSSRPSINYPTGDDWDGFDGHFADSASGSITRIECRWL